MDVPLAPLGGAVRRFAGVTGGALDRDDALRFDGDASPGAARFAARRIEVDTVFVDWNRDSRKAKFSAV